MAVIIKIKKDDKKRTLKLTPLQERLLNAPSISEKQIRKIEEAGKLTGKWKV